MCMNWFYSDFVARKTVAKLNLARLIDANDALIARPSARVFLSRFLPLPSADGEFWHGEREAAKLDPADTLIRRCSK